MAGSSSTVVTAAAFSLLMMFFGVPLGTNRPAHNEKYNLVNPTWPHRSARRHRSHRHFLCFRRLRVAYRRAAHGVGRLPIMRHDVYRLQRKKLTKLAERSF